ncbi:5-methyltetrahydrofolate--homocysteine methyltransferase [Mycobacteroides abscessus]|nr:5-methyltetrahydrofolate--homocysteine methyltransferase [Mycobacteroides abscessus]
MTNLQPNVRPDCTEALTAALEQRILVIDGAMGTAIQRDRPDEAGYRGSASPTGRATLSVTTISSR